MIVSDDGIVASAKLAWMGWGMPPWAATAVAGMARFRLVNINAEEFVPVLDDTIRKPAELPASTHDVVLCMGRGRPSALVAPDGHGGTRIWTTVRRFDRIIRHPGILDWLDALSIWPTADTPVEDHRPRQVDHDGPYVIPWMTKEFPVPGSDGVTVSIKRSLTDGYIGACQVHARGGSPRARWTDDPLV